jgi:hypothetical protein
MTTHADAAPKTCVDPDAERDERHDLWLKQLGELSMTLARDLASRAKDQDADPAKVAAAFDRVARAVRLTIALETKLAEDRKARDRGDPGKERAAWKARWDAQWAKEPPAQRRRDILRNVIPDMIRARDEREPWRERKERYEEAEDLIDRELDDSDVLNRPITEVIAVICETLGVEPDWSLWDPAEWTHKDFGLTEAEIEAGCPVERPRRLVFDAPDNDDEAAADAAERRAVHSPP